MLHMRNGRSSKAHIYRLPYAVEVYKNGLVSKIIVSGGRNIGNANMVEADYLKEKAIEFGIKKKDILVENKAMTTWENMKLSRELMIKNNLLGECTNIAIVTSYFHMRRSIMIAERVFRDDGVNIVSLPGEDNSTRRTTWFTNEKGRVRAIGEVEKIIDYVKKGKIDDFEII
ncbi:YdcF family protein [Eubacterium sp. AF17-7]|nr:YdcF family protein [Eubacterium sp. AF17-7]